MKKYTHFQLHLETMQLPCICGCQFCKLVDCISKPTFQHFLVFTVVFKILGKEECVHYMAVAIYVQVRSGYAVKVVQLLVTVFSLVASLLLLQPHGDDMWYTISLERSHVSRIMPHLYITTTSPVLSVPTIS